MPNKPKKKPLKTFRITFRAEIFLRAESKESAEEIFGGIDLFSKDAYDCGASYVETNSVEER